eukprot:gene1958-2558_t
MAWLISKTRLGLFVRGVTQNRPIASCMGVNTARIDTYAFALGSGIAGLAGCALSQVGNVGPDLGQGYIVDSFMVVVLGGVGQLAGTVYAALGLGVLNKFLEGWAGAVLAKIAVLVMMNSLALPSKPVVLTRTGWTAFVIALLVVCALAPLLNLVVPESSVFHMSDYAVALVGKIMCYAIAALAMDLIWGYTGILSLGHGLFFALGGYAMGMYLMRQIGRDGNYKSDLPDFMVFLDWKELPWHWAFSDSFVATLFLIVAVPGLVAFVFGYFAFRSRIKGVYFSIITQ